MSETTTKNFTPDFSAKGGLLAGSQYGDKALYGKEGSGKDLADSMGKGGKAYAANIDELKKKIKTKRVEKWEDELDLEEIIEEEKVFDDEEEAASETTTPKLEYDEIPRKSDGSIDFDPKSYQRAVAKKSAFTKSSPWKKSSSVMKKYEAGNPEEQVIRDSFGWGTRNRDERGADLGKYIYESTRPHIVDLQEKFNRAQYTHESTHTVIGELSERSNQIQTFKSLVGEASDITNKGLWGKLTTSDMWKVDNIVGQEPGMLEMDFDSDTNQLQLKVAQLDGGYENVSLSDFSDIITKNIRPAAKKKAHFENLANLRQLGVNGKPIPDNLVETKLNQITPQNIAQLMLNPVFGAQSFVEEAEHDPELKDLNISAKNVYNHVLENIDDPKIFNDAKVKLAEYWAAKEEEAYNKGRDIRNKKNEELRRTFTKGLVIGSGAAGVQREEELTPTKKKTDGMTTSQKIQYYKNL